jgi:hypothetical protein
MVQFILGLALGMYLATHNAADVANVIDEGVQTVKSVKITKENK